MKKWKCTFWRYNPQLHDDGYETTRTIEARTADSAWKKAEKKYSKCVYGSMSLCKVELVEE